MKFVKLGLGIRFDSDIFYEKETDSSDLKLWAHWNGFKYWLGIN